MKDLEETEMEAEARHKTQIAAKRQKQPISIKLTIIGCVILLISAPWIIYIYNFVPEDDPEADLELEHYAQEVIDDLKNYALSKALDLIASNVEFNTNIKTLEDILNNNLEQTIRTKYQPYYLAQQKIEISVNYFDVKLEPNFKTMSELDRYPKTDPAEPRLEVFSAGRYYDTTVPYSYAINGDLELTAQKLSKTDGNGNGFLKRNLKFEEILQTPHLFIDYKLQQFQNQAKTAYSDLGRIMNYMLTTLARMRAYTIETFGSLYSHKNILNEGDIELCLNLALILEEALLFRAYDPDSISTMDKYFYNADDALHPDNPTGKRLWGNAEEQNYEEYVSRKSLITDDGSRLFSTLVNKYLTQGTIDPADLMGLYLILDKGPRSAIIDSPLDTDSMLQARYGTSYLMDPQDVTDPADATNIKYILPLNDDTQTGSESGNNIELIVDQQPNYLVFGADFKTLGLDDPRAWHTTAAERTQGRGTRTQSVVPQRPAEHDYRLEWQLNIQGKFSLSLMQDDEVNNPWFNGIWQTQEIKFDFPLHIYVWFDGIPNINSIDSDNFNVGNPTPDGWIITTESHLVEYFENSFWKFLKPMASLGFDVSHSIIPYSLANQGMVYRSDKDLLNQDMTTIPDNSVISNWISDIILFQSQGLDQILEQHLANLWPRFDTFMNLYFMDYLRQYNPEYGFFNFTDKPQFPFEAFLPWISVLGHEVSLFFDMQTNVLEIQFMQPNGYFEILIEGFNTSKEQLRIVLTNHITLPGILNLTSTVASSINDIDPSKPEIFVDGELYNKYTITTRAHPRPDLVLGTRDTDIGDTERFLVTRAKFGSLYHAATIQLPEQSLGLQLEEVSIDLDFFVPADQKQNAAGLEQSLAGVISDLGTESISATDQDRYILDMVYTSSLFQDLSESLINWFNTVEGTPKLAMDLSISSISAPNPYAFMNLTIFLSEPQSSENFVRWFGANGLDLILALSSSNNLNRELATALTTENQFFIAADLEMIDFELSSRKLEHEMQLGMNIGDNLMKEYQLPDKERQNLTLILVITGRAMMELAFGSEGVIKEGADDGNTITYSQVYYCHQTLENDLIRTQLLLGTDILTPARSNS